MIGVADENGNRANVNGWNAADGQGNLMGINTLATMWAYNGGGHDRWRNNHEVTVIALAARTASANSADMFNHNARGAIIAIDVTAIAATPSITVTIKGKDSLSGKFLTILASAAISAVGTTRLIIYPGITAAANLKVDEPLPRIWRAEVVNVDADSITYSIGANYIV